MNEKMNLSINEEEQNQVTEDKLQELQDKLTTLDASVSKTDEIDEFNVTLQHLPFQNTMEYQFSSENNVDDTKRIDGVDLAAMMEEDFGDQPQMNQSSGKETAKGKVLTKTKPGAPSFDNSDAGQILTSFIACVQLAGITALMGAAWLVNLVMQIR